MMIGSLISHFRILEKLGEGGMGVVYKARDTMLDRDVALKFLRSDALSDPDARKRFIREARAASALNHPNICTIYSISESDGNPFIEMELLEGKNLRTILEERELGLQEVLEIAVQIGEGLNAAHEKGIVHRDIKPGNIMVMDAGLVKITDFGLAKVKGTSTLTRTHSTRGTLAYMSPEQAHGMEIDHRSDIFSFGVVLYEMIARRPPFRGEHEAALVYSVVNESPEPLARYKSDVPDEIERIVEKALAKERDRRYQHIDEMLADLRNVLSDMPHMKSTRVRRRRLPFFLGGGLILAMSALLAYVLWPSKPAVTGEKSIAVLPFVDMSPEQDQQYFCDGMTEELITRLSSVQDLKVPARTSSFTFKGKTPDVREIGEKLRVRTVLEGSIRKSGNRLRVTAQLINIADGYHLWSEEYDRELKDVFAVQDEISSAIVRALRVKLTSREMLRMSEHSIANVAAYECYLKALYGIGRLTEEALDRSVKQLQTGLDEIGGNALLYSGMSWAYYQYVNVGVEQQEYLGKAEDYANRALALDPGLPVAHTMLGMLSFYKPYPENLQQGIRHYKTALSGNPNEPLTLQNLSWLYSFMGRPSAAHPFLERVQDVDPLNAWNLFYEGLFHFYRAEYELALPHFRRFHQVNSDNPLNKFYYAWTLAYSDSMKEALFIVDQSARAAPNNTAVKCGLLLKYALLHDRERAFREISADFEKTCRRDAEWSYDVAVMLALLNAKEEALDWLENAVDHGFIGYPILERNPFLDTIRGEKRFKTLMKKVEYEWAHFQE